MKRLNLFLILLLVFSFAACGRRYAKPTRCICYDEQKFKVYEESVVFYNVRDNDDNAEARSKMSSKLISALNSEKNNEGNAGHVKEKLTQAIAQALSSEQTEFKVNLENLYEQNLFATNSARISARDYNGLDVVANFLKKTPDTIKVRIEGHTDSTGRRAYNQTLSEKRAKAIANYFINKGIDPKRITTRGYGETRPIASNATEEGKAKNRRTEMIFLFSDGNKTERLNKK